MAVATVAKKWTLEELHSLPEDGNKFEIVRGELFVTPPPSVPHEEVAAILHAILAPYVERERLGRVYRPKAIVRFQGSEVEPDLFVRQRHPNPRRIDADWNTAPTPILVVEIASPYTRRRDRAQKRRLYMDAGVAEYWMVDDEERAITVVRHGARDRVERSTLSWRPAAARETLSIDVATVFGC